MPQVSTPPDRPACARSGRIDDYGRRKWTPLLVALQLRRLAVREALGISRTGSMLGKGSVDVFIAFSTANAGAAEDPNPVTASMLTNRRIDNLF